MRLKKSVTAACTVFAGLSSYMFYSHYLKWDFNREGLAFDPVEGVSYSENAYVWGVLAAILFIPFFASMFLRLRKVLFKKDGGF